ncbi:MAG TPA: hypothetical protein VJR27_02600 [Candidatus Saccharimonadales bacterium]|nr:hypothetical protein [Candidatus Saccharimonadales bacterium]
MSDAHKNLPPKENSSGETHKRSFNWSKIGGIAGIVGAVAACLALYPLVVKDPQPPKTEQHLMFDGPIARIATNEKAWDERGFEPNEMNSMSSEITYRYAGHYSDPINGDHNPNNEMCAIKLRANPSATFPYAGDSGFVYLQPGNPKHTHGTTLYNPTLETIYQTRLDYDDPIPQECYPGNMKFPHDFREYS